MAWRMSRIRALALALAALGWVPLARGQDQVDVGFPDEIAVNPQGGVNSLLPPSQGEWAQVITVTNKWLVIQNQKGQQFPVAIDKIGLFLIRWPTKIDEVDEGTMIEANGQELGTTEVLTDHIDVFAGTAAELVRPGFASQSTFSAMANNFQIQTNLQFNLFQPFYGVGSAPIVTGEMGWARVAAPLAGLDPVRVVLQGNSIVTIRTTENCTVTSVTPGSSSVLRKGDLVYFVPSEPTPKSYNLAQLVGYKNVPMNRVGR